MKNLNLPYARADAILRGMSVEQKLGQMLMASIEVAEMDEKTRRFLTGRHVGNVILFGKNCENRAQLARLNADIQRAVCEGSGGVQALLSIDQEGGGVTRIRNGATVFPCAMAVGDTGDPENAYLAGHIMGNEMRALGIAFDLAPVLDTNGERRNPIIGRRSYGPTAEETARFGGAFAKGLRDSGLIDCGKHFPGHGDSTVDTHFATSVVDTPADVAREKFIRPFRIVIGEGMRAIMSTHICYPSLDPSGVPATLSRPILQGVLRGELGFEGLIISDGMQMLAIRDVYGAPRGCVLAAKAGCDLLIIGNGGDNADPNGEDVQTPCIDALLEAVKSGELPMERVEDAARRVIAFKLLLGDMSPAPDVVSRDWRAHEAFARALAEMSVRILSDEGGLRPLPEGALFLSRVSRARLGVEEGDKLVDGFAPMAARLCRGEPVEFADRPDLSALRARISAAPAVVFAAASAKELSELIDDIRAVHALNPKLCFVCLDVPPVAEAVDFAPLILASYDQTVHAIRAVCAALRASA